MMYAPDRVACVRRHWPALATVLRCLGRPVWLAALCGLTARLTAGA